MNITILRENTFIERMSTKQELITFWNDFWNAKVNQENAKKNIELATMDIDHLGPKNNMGSIRINFTFFLLKNWT